MSRQRLAFSLPCGTGVVAGPPPGWKHGVPICTYTRQPTVEKRVVGILECQRVAVFVRHTVPAR